MAAKTTSAIGRPPKRHVATLTPAERLTKLDPELAALFDSLEATLDREYDLAAVQTPPVPILETAGEWALEAGRLDVTLRPMLEIADGLKAARDEAAMTLGRLEQEIARRTVEALRLTPQAALPPPPPDRFDGGDNTEDFSALSKEPWRRQVSFYPPPDEDWGFDADPPTKPSLAVRVGGWWRRVWAPIKTALLTPAPLLWGGA